uniref:ANK_REP_REGION domain-containing protein n=1 Tax=Macrostomum lignano TaxID=282301 RepID=A0A1I8H9V8_9PLAT
MKKLFGKGKSGKDSNASSSAKGAGGYNDIKEKSLPKIHKAAWTGDHKKIATFQQDVNTPDSEQRMALHLASFRGHEKVVDTLITFGARTDALDSEGRSPLYRAVQMNRAQCARPLLKAGSKREDEGLVIAVNNGSTEMVALLLDSWHPHRLNAIAGKSLLHLAVTNGNAEVLSLLLQRASGPDELDAEGRTPLMLACREGHADLAALLLKAGADPAARDSAGQSCADFAAGQAACASLLADARPAKSVVRTATPTVAAVAAAAGSTAKPQTSSDYEEDESKSDYAIPTLDSARSDRSLGGGGGGGGRRSISLNDFHAGGKVDVFDPETQQTRSLKVPIVRDSRRRSRSPSPAVSASLDSGSEDDLGPEAARIRLSGQRSESARASLAVVPETAANRAATSKSNNRKKPDAPDNDDDDDDWSESISVDKEPSPRINLKQAMEQRKRQAVFLDDQDDDTQKPVFQRQESDWDASEISEVVPEPTAANSGPAKDDDEAESDWDDSVAAPVAAESASKAKQVQGGEGADSDSDWDGSEAATTARSKPKDSAREEPVSDWDTSTEAGDSVVSPRRPPPPPPPPQQHQEQLGRRLSKTDKDGLQPIAEESTPASQRNFDSQRKEGADTVIAAMLQENQLSETPPPVAAVAAAKTGNSSLSDDDDEDGSLPPVPMEVARLQAQLDDFSRQLAASRADCSRSEAERQRLAEELAELARRLSDAEENLQSEADRRAALAEKLDEQREAARAEARAREDARAEAEALHTERDSALARLRAAEADLAQARDALETERQAVAAAAAAATERRSTADRVEDDADTEGLTAEVEASRRRADVAEREAADLRAEVETLRGRMRAQETRWLDERAQLEGQAAEAEAASREALAKMALSLEAARADALEQRQRAEAERAEAGQLQARLAALTESAGQGDKQAADLAGQLHQAKEAAVRLEEQLAAERAKSAASQEELHRALDAAKEASAESRRFRSELAASQAELREARAETRKLRETEAALASAEGRLAGAEQANADLRDQLQRLAAAASKGDEKESQLQQRLCDILNGYRDDFDKTRTSLERNQGCLAGELAQTRSDLRASEQRSEKQQAELLSLRHEQAGLMRKLSQAEADLACAKETKVELEKEKIGLQYEAGSLKTEVTGLRAEIVSLKEEISALRSGGAGFRQRASSAAAAAAGADDEAAAAAGASHGSGNGKMTSWRADEYEERIRHQEVRNVKLEMSLDFEQRKVRGLTRELDSLNETVREAKEDFGKCQRAKAELLDKLKVLNESHMNRLINQAEEKARKEAENALEQLKETSESDRKTMSKLNLRLEKAKEELAFRVEEERLTWQKSELGRKQLESKVKDYERRYGDFETELTALRGSLKQQRRRTKELGLADFDSERRAMDDALATVRSRVQLLQSRLALQDTNQDRLEAENRSLQGDLMAVRSLEEALAKLEEQKDRAEAELTDYKAYIKANFVAKCELAKYKEDVEHRARDELNQRLGQMNDHLAGQQRVRDEVDARRDEVERKLREDAERLQMSVDDLRRTCLDMSAERDRLSSDCQHYRQLYDQEKRVRQKLTEELERLNNTEAQTAAALSLDRERHRLASGVSQFSFQQPLMQPQHQQQYNMYSSNQSLSSPDPLLQQRLRSELDRSISKHLESDNASRMFVSKTRSTVNLSRTVAESDPNYLDFLKKKYHV